MRLRLIALACVLSLLSLCDLAAQTTARTPPLKLPVLAPGIYNQTLRRPDGPAVNYAIWIPPSYVQGKPVPLILALHYGGGPGSGRGVLQILIGPALAEVGGIIIAPDTMGGSWESADNQRAVNALLDAAIASYSIETRKIAVTGYSMGGAGTWYWADRYPDRFSAAIPVAGDPTPPRAAFPNTAFRVPVFAVHSRNDEVVPIGPTEQRIAEMRRVGRNAQIVVLTGMTHFQTDRHVEGLRRAVPWLKELWK